MARGQLDFGLVSDEAASEEMDEALAALGLECDDESDVDQEVFWLWPENEEVFWLWAGLQTQWVIGMAGATGLNYSGVEVDLRMLVPKKKHRDYYLFIKNMEQAALDEWASKR
jgi:hypothetical protein